MKYSYSQSRQMFIASVYNPVAGKVEIVDADEDMCALMIRHGFMIDDEGDAEEFDPLAEVEDDE